MNDAPLIRRPTTAGGWARLTLVLLLAVYGIVWMRDPARWDLLSGVNLLIHEAGHPLFGLFGEFAGFAGGTLLQLMMPIAFLLYFAIPGDWYAASVALWWIAHNLWGISVYAGDARAQLLPLLNDGEHDWAYMLGRLHWLAHDQDVRRAIFLAGVICYAVAIAVGLRTAARGRPVPPVSRDARDVA